MTLRQRSAWRAGPCCARHEEAIGGRALLTCLCCHRWPTSSNWQRFLQTCKQQLSSWQQRRAIPVALELWRGLPYCRQHMCARKDTRTDTRTNTRTDTRTQRGRTQDGAGFVMGGSHPPAAPFFASQAVLGKGARHFRPSPASAETPIACPGSH